MATQEFEPLVEGYLSYITDVKRLNRRTLSDIRCTLRKAIAVLANVRPHISLWKMKLDDFLIWIEHEREAGKSNHSISKQISHIRGLLDYAWRNGRSDRNVLEGFYLKDVDRSTPPRVLTIDEAKKMVELYQGTTKQERKKRIIILLFYGCGLRTKELCDLDIQDINREKQEIFVKKSKGDIERYIPVPKGVWIELLAYLSDRGGKRGPLFRTSVKRKRIRSTNLLEIVKEASERARLEGKITPKTLRHTFASHLMDAGVNLGVISSLMGHRSPRETGVYLHAFNESKKNAVNKILSKKN